MDEHPSDFWLVWNPMGGNPAYRHLGSASATVEAERLASLNPGQEFYVLHAISVSRRPKLVETLILGDGLPF